MCPDKNIVNDGLKNKGTNFCSSSCLQENSMSLEQYNAVCKNEFKEIKDALKGFEKRLFIDNGTKSIQTILNEHSIWQKNIEEHLALVAQQELLRKKKTKDLSFVEWVMFNWKSISAVGLVILWLVIQFYPPKSFSVSQQQELKNLLRTTVLDTRIDEDR